MNKHKYIIQLYKEERVLAHTIIRRGKHNTRVITRARILLLSSRGVGKDGIAERLYVSRSTVQRIRDRYRSGGLDAALYDAPRTGQPKKLTDEDETYLIATACSDPPAGRKRWTLELLQERLKKEREKYISTVAIWHRLENRDIKPWREKNVVYS